MITYDRREGETVMETIFNIVEQALNLTPQPNPQDKFKNQDTERSTSWNAYPILYVGAACLSILLIAQYVYRRQPRLTETNQSSTYTLVEAPEGISERKIYNETTERK